MLYTSASSKIQGTVKKTYEESITIMASFKSYGGTNIKDNGVLIVEDTAIIETWYNPLITEDCKFKCLTNNAEYEIIGAIENISMRNKVIKIKVRRINTKR